MLSVRERSCHRTLYFESKASHVFVDVAKGEDAPKLAQVRTLLCCEKACKATKA